MDEQFEAARCAICQRDEAKSFIRSVGPAQIVKCRNDGLLYMNPRPSRGFIQNFHASFVRESNKELFLEYRRAVLRREADAIKKRKPGGGKLLDIGCATGTFFENFHDGRWRLFGIDTSALGVELARLEQGAEVSCGTLASAEFPNLSFDVVSILDTIYYSPDPAAELLESHRVLKNDGLLAVEIPGLTYTLWRDKGLLCWLLDDTWMRGFTNSHHLYYFSRNTLRLLLEKTGFRIIQKIPEQVSLRRRGLIRLVTDAHFMMSKAVFKATGGRLSFAGKEFYLATKNTNYEGIIS